MFHDNPFMSWQQSNPWIVCVRWTQGRCNSNVRVWGPTELGSCYLDWRSESISLLILFQSYWQEVWLKEWLHTRHSDLRCGYLVFWILRWLIEVDLLHLDQRWEKSSLSLLLQGYDRRFGLGSSCLQDAWSKMWLLHVLPKQQNILLKDIVAWYFKYWNK